MRPVRVLSVLALVLALGLLPGCGGDDADQVASSGTGDTSAAGDAGEVAPEDVAEDAPDAAGGSGGGVLDICSLVTTDDMEAVLGASTTLAPVPGGGCSFNQDDPRAASVSLGAMELDEANGGFDGALSGVTALIEGEVVDVDLGDRAIVVVGPSFGGTSEQGGGLIGLGSTLVQVTVVQASEMSADAVSTLVTDVLALVASQA
jgi:hypothetical protein